ncbi:MAG: tRNA (N(6)-L-threonylcarbamoyladenosine(37)-C(2))-methylthiotransferase MtaB [Oceanicaulis sp.]|uniref:tRNA (N(6)-L-threonylcarbamoyladenosine(37)-C(2))- methylthiotransferase MtaB n=1 Tax=Glycocaulis sp. TaxID=1969725 RepID=UPI0025C6E44C|nr:tRNA (N(6)-L-threonylcarbamoyladenosine(37)-C(2))-methylthiotransferase MtaB [Glycocaulis sp.]MCC5980997.1 tRNA (N(6)-L-threonylcarbamoyladenosine(37)-C(2))-methylthiotransferase MtaB [Oceanicaulis sp.]MCH8522257.1 tRNA (N(6)-L-threonylcarbamoyladenosine(37)-C(2))-methylthiotransferase MtaB [Glycocaulis sp.]
MSTAPTAHVPLEPEDPAAPARGEGTDGVDIITFGCRLNAWESEVMRGHAREAGLTDAIIINTCAVTNEAVRQARQAIRRARKDRPGAHLIVTGCAAQIDPLAFAKMPEVDRVIGNAEKLKSDTFRSAVIRGGEAVSVGDIMAVTELAGHLVDGLEGRARAYVQVQTGCDHRCTFCIIPYGRGNARSAPAGEVVDQVRRLVETGHSEVVLTGVDMTSWGTDLPGQPKLGRLVRAILKQVPDLKRLRLSSIDAIEIDDDLMAAIAEEERLCPYLHLSLQAGDDMVLKRMKRRHLRADAIALTDRLKAIRPDIAFGADLIAGFPTETEAMFENSLRLVEECQLAYLHVFPYSPRPGTPAARMPQVNGAVIKERAKRLREAGEAALTRHLASMVGREEVLLVEKPGEARAANFAPVRIETPARPGALVRAAITGHDGTHLIARAVEAA